MLCKHVHMISMRVITEHISACMHACEAGMHACILIIISV